MNQALHIFRKDVRYLRFEIAGFLAMTAIFGLLAGAGWPGDVLEIAALFLVARLIHAEAIPGDRQFWLTRPYRPMSLCGAKMLFIVLFLCLPIGLAHIAMLLRLGFPLASEIPGLIWSQVLLFFVGALPVTALAALTDGVVAFVAPLLTLAVVALLGGTSLPFMFPRLFVTMPATTDWVRDFVMGVSISGVAAVILVWQYRDRRTLFSRLFGVIAFNVVMAVYLWWPIPVSLAATTLLSKQPGIAESVRVTVDAARRREGISPVPGSRESLRNLRIPIPLVVSGLPRDGEARSDDLSVSLDWPDRSWKASKKPGVASHSEGNGEVVLDALVPLDADLLNSRRQTPLTIRGSIYLTVFGEPERRQISLKHGKVNVQDGLQCFSEDLGLITQLVCRSFFRWPSRFVYAEQGDEKTDFSKSIVSYSPFPAGLSLEPLESRWTEPPKSDEVTIVTKRPLAHFRRDFELKGARLADFAKAPQAPKPPGIP